MTYVDGYLLAVPKKNLKDYIKMAKAASKVWMKYGALYYAECQADDLSNPMCKLKFSKIINAKPNEVVFYSFAIYKSKAQRDSVNKKVMKDPILNSYCKEKVPFDMKRMVFGGFKTVVEAKK